MNKKYDSTYSICLDILGVMGGDVTKRYDSTYSILKEILGNIKSPAPIAVWDAKGRSNNEPAATRNILKDKSGNGHDIELRNMDFEGMSGYGGYNIYT